MTLQNNTKIMIVDDDMLHSLEVEEQLRNIGYQVVSLTVPNGLLAQVEYEEPDLLLIDLQMDGLKKNDLLGAVSELTRSDRIVTVIYSHMEIQEMVRMCETYDLNGYYSKKMDISKLGTFVGDILG